MLGFSCAPQGRTAPPPRFWARGLLPWALVCVLACEPGESASPGSPRTVATVAREEPTVTSESAPPVESESDVGSVTIRRLNRVEYDNTVRDLIGDTSHPSRAFPPDNGAEGFTNNADALTISPILIEGYEAAAEKLAAKAFDNPAIVTCSADRLGDTVCATQVLSRFARRAWRRTTTPTEISRLVAIVESERARGRSFREAMELAFETTLLSPHFLFRIESDPDPASKAPHPLSDFELASRLSYFLWSSMPDDALLAYAEAGRLSSPRVFDAQVKRMLDDPKAGALVDDFAADWLLHTMGDAAPDGTLFPGFDASLRASMTNETKEFLRSFLFGDQSLTDMLDAPFTYVDGRMAAFYGLPEVTGSTPVRVPLGATSQRSGLLGHASVLTMTSVATRTSPVRRGEWVLSELLCSPPPPPPPDVPALAENATAGSIRERMEEHRKNPVCASCHSQMDPIGFALENYDAIGRWRDTDDGVRIDATGQLPSGLAIDGARDLAQAIKGDPRFPSCSTRKLYAYALGRSPTPRDAPRLFGLTKAFVQGNHRTKDLIMNIASSDAFRMRRARDAQ